MSKQKTNYDQETIRKIQKSIISARASLEAAENWLKQIAGDDLPFPVVEDLPYSIDHVETNIFYGVFNGEVMITADEQTFNVPSNYASKSKLIEGDKLKLTIKDNGAFIYKQVGLADRSLKTGELILDGNTYKVVADNRTYIVPYASITYFRANIGDTLTIIAPTDEGALWAAVENVIPA